MGYTQDDFEDWIILIDFKMDYFTGEFAKELDELEGWILANYKEIKDLIADSKMLDYLTIYIGETFRKYIGGKWYIDLKNKKNAYYSMPVLTDPSYKYEPYAATMTFATACIARQKGNYISTILRNNL